MTDSAIYQSVRRRTQAEFGKALNLHAVRHGSATTIAIYAPESIATAAILLTHVDPRTTERYYNQAGSISAGHAYASVVDNLSRTAAHQSGGKKRERRRCEP